MRTLPSRLPPGTDLRRELERIVAASAEQSAFVLSGIGSLSHAGLRFAGADVPTLLAEPLEIVSLAGSIAAQGAHLHASISTASGHVLGGHLGYGCIVRTTAEVLVALLPEWTLAREHDPVSGYDELTVSRRSES